MTQDELDALPINEFGTIKHKREMRADGVTLLIPYMGEGKIMYVKPDDYICIVDRQGNPWKTGWIDGVRHKQDAGHILRALGG
jgi:hypothetical protein